MLIRIQSTKVAGQHHDYHNLSKEKQLKGLFRSGKESYLPTVKLSIQEQLPTSFCKGFEKFPKTSNLHNPKNDKP